MRRVVLASLLLLVAAQAAQAAPARSTGPADRISFRITTIEESARGRTVVSEAEVDGPRGTDFTVRLETERFRMSASFVTDLTREGNLKVRSLLETRRLYGYSSRNLPLYEEDVQSPSMEIGMDEALALLPFGQSGGPDVLKIEIVPSYSERGPFLAGGRPRPLEIRFLKNDPGGAIAIEARKIPHHYLVEAQVLEGDRPLFSAESPVFFDERKAILLEPSGGSPAAGTYRLDLNIDDFQHGDPAGLVSLSFDLDRIEGRRRSVAARNWAGKAPLERPLEYAVQDEHGRSLRLRLEVRLAEVEGS